MPETYNFSESYLPGKTFLLRDLHYCLASQAYLKSPCHAHFPVELMKTMLCVMSFVGTRVLLCVSLSLFGQCRVIKIISTSLSVRHEMCRMFWEYCYSPPLPPWMGC